MSDRVGEHQTKQKIKELKAMCRCLMRYIDDLERHYKNRIAAHKAHHTMAKRRLQAGK